MISVSLRVLLIPVTISPVAQQNISGVLTDLDSKTLIPYLNNILEKSMLLLGITAGVLLHTI